jgi:hypothetical protein
MSMPVEVFFSYAQEDEDWLKKIEKYLSTLQRQKYVQGWHDHNILAGSEWEGGRVIGGEQADYRSL